jgi:hypothetical protein
MTMQKVWMKDFGDQKNGPVKVERRGWKDFG